MTEIAQLFESALRNNRANLLRKAAVNTVTRMPPNTTLHELLGSDAAEAIRELTLQEFRSALEEGGFVEAAPKPRVRRRIQVHTSDSGEWTETREEQIYRRILDAMSDSPLTIGQLAKRVDIDVDELRGYLTWMKKMGKVTSSGRARATRYQAVR